MILSIDTCNSLCSVALADENFNVIKYEVENTPSSQSRRLLNMINSALGDYSLDDITKIVVTVGPGSFTGVRIGMAAVDGICFVKPDIQIIAVSTLSAVAATSEFEMPFMVALNASRGQYYTQKFDDYKFPISDIELVESYEHSNVIDDVVPDAINGLMAAKLGNIVDFSPIYIREANITKPKNSV